MNDNDKIPPGRDELLALEDRSHLSLQSVAHDRAFHAAARPQSDAGDRTVIASGAQREQRAVHPVPSAVHGGERGGVFQSRRVRDVCGSAA